MSRTQRSDRSVAHGECTGNSKQDDLLSCPLFGDGIAAGWQCCENLTVMVSAIRPTGSTSSLVRCVSRGSIRLAITYQIVEPGGVRDMREARGGDSVAGADGHGAQGGMLSHPSPSHDACPPRHPTRTRLGLKPPTARPRPRRRLHHCRGRRQRHINMAPADQLQKTTPPTVPAHFIVHVQSRRSLPALQHGRTHHGYGAAVWRGVIHFALLPGGSLLH